MTNFRGLLFIASVVAATVTFATWAIFRHWGPSWYSDWEVITLGSVYNICFLIVSTALGRIHTVVATPLMKRCRDVEGAPACAGRDATSVLASGRPWCL